MADDDTSLASELSAAMGDTSTQTAPESATATVDPSAQPGAATTAPAGATAADTSTDQSKPQGPIPFEVHKTALENARTKEREAALAEWRQQHGWAEQVNRADIEQAVKLAQRYKSDRIAFLQELVKETQDDPVFGPQLASWAARTLASRRGQSGGGEGFQLPEPDVAITDASGQTVGGTYSGGLLKQIVTGAVQQAVQQAVAATEQKFAPLATSVQSWQKREAEAEHKRQVDQFGETTFADMQTWQGMDDEANRRAVGEAILAAQVDGEDPRDVLRVAEAAYRRIVVPKLMQARLSDQVQQTHLKAQANTVSPAASSAGTPKSYADMSTAEALRHELAAMKR